MRRFLGGHGVWVLVSLSVWMLGSVGCTHHHYYGATPVCEAPVGSGRVITAPVVADTYCDVPGTVGTPVVVATNPGRAGAVVVNRRPPTLVTSQPRGAGGGGSGLGLGGWRDRRDGGGATTRISGAVDDDAIAR